MFELGEGFISYTRLIRTSFAYRVKMGGILRDLAMNYTGPFLAKLVQCFIISADKIISSSQSVKRIPDELLMEIKWCTKHHAHCISMGYPKPLWGIMVQTHRNTLGDQFV